MTNLVYFSSVSGGNTHRFIEKLGRPAARIPVFPREEPLTVDEPTCSSSRPTAVATAMAPSRSRSSGSSTIRTTDRPCAASSPPATPTSAPLRTRRRHHRREDRGVPTLYRFEVFGTPDDVRAVDEGLDAFWQAAQQLTA